MALIEAWWGNANSSPELRIAQTRQGFTIDTVAAGDPSTMTWRFYVAPERMTEPDGPCLSAPALLLDGSITGETKGSLMGDGDPHLSLRFELSQRVFITDIPVASAKSDHLVLDVKGDWKKKTVDLRTFGPLPFPPLLFEAQRGREIRIETELLINRHFHKTQRSSTWPDFRALVPQWGLVFLALAD